MGKIIRCLKKKDLSRAYRAILLIVDITCINLSSFMALLIRFNLEITKIPVKYSKSVWDFAIINTVVTVAIFAMLRLYRSLWRFASIKELINIVLACACSSLINIMYFSITHSEIYISYHIIYLPALFIMTCGSRFIYRLLRVLYRENIAHNSLEKRTMVIGAGEACNVVIKELGISYELSAKICCLIDDDKSKQGTYLHGIKVVGGRDKILEEVKKYHIDEIIIAIPSAPRSEIKDIIEICNKAQGCELKILPGVYQLVKGEVSVSEIRNVEIEDLLAREVTRITVEVVGKYISGKVVLITGGGGSIGSELCRQVAANGVSKLIIFDMYENNAYEIQQELKDAYPNMELVVLIGSVRNSKKVDDLFNRYRPDIVYHAAAHKHVPLMEASPNEAIKNNVFGTYNVATSADKYKAEKFILISTDKAVNPTNIMGASKRICEMIIQTFSTHSKTEFAAVRFGNVLGSNGSVIPLFKKQMEKGGPITVTHPEIIRYFMTIPEAVSLILRAGASAKGGEIFVLDMGKPVKIVDLAKNLIKLSGYTLGVDMDIKFTGLRPGEKLYEELLMEEEGLQSTDNKMIFIGKPIEFDEKKFLENLKVLYKEAYNENSRMKEIVREIVPTYKLRDEDRWKKEESKTTDWKEELLDVHQLLSDN